MQKFVAAYKAKYNGETPDAMAALGYDSAMVLADAIKRAGSTDGPKLRDALAATKDFPGVTGTITLDANRDAVQVGGGHDGQGRQVQVRRDHCALKPAPSSRRD